jgi:hypothetical protein
MKQLYSHWSQQDPRVVQMTSRPLSDEFTLDGPTRNPFAPLSYEDACDIADALDLPDGDWDLINQAYNIVE